MQEKIELTYISLNKTSQIVILTIIGENNYYLKYFKEPITFQNTLPLLFRYVCDGFYVPSTALAYRLFAFLNHLKRW